MALVWRQRPRAHLAGRPREPGDEPARVDVERAEIFLDQPEEPRAQPWNSRELESVGDLVQRDPQRELVEDEVVLARGLGHVASDEVEGRAGDEGAPPGPGPPA